MKINDKFQNTMHGDFDMKLINNQSGELIDEIHEPNVIVQNAYYEQLDLLDNNNEYIYKVKLGDDVGNGTISEPEQPTLNTTASEQNIVLPVGDVSDITVQRSIDYTDYSLTTFTLISGTDVLETTGEDSIEFTSAGLYMSNDGLFAYRRFPVRSISSVVDVSITWTIYYNIP